MEGGEHLSYTPVDEHDHLDTVASARPRIDLSLLSQEQVADGTRSRNSTSDIASLSWARFWPLPVAALTYITHLRLRRAFPYHFGRRQLIPKLTSLRLAEVYAIGSLAIAVEMENDRNGYRLLNDPVLLQLEDMALGARGSWIQFQKDREKDGQGLSEDFFSQEARLANYPTDGSWIARLSWYYDHIWSGPAAYNVAAGAVAILTQEAGPPNMSPEDRDTLPTSPAGTSNLYATTCGVQTNNHTPPFGTLLTIVTPFSMLARLRPPLTTLPVMLMLNFVQRTLVYVFVGGGFMQRYQHLACLHRLRDPDSVLGNLMGHEKLRVWRTTLEKTG